MRNRLGVILCIFIGSFCLYCGQSAMTMLGNGHGHRDGGSAGSTDGPIGDAMAQSGGGGTCCTPPAQTFTKLAEGDLTASNGSSSVISVGNYREIVLYTSGSITGCSSTVLKFRADASSAYGTFFELSGNASSARLQVNGAQAVINSLFSGGNCSDSIHFVVAGVS
jgi:hypothetical protein